jgi:hypothetical protein
MQQHPRGTREETFVLLPNQSSELHVLGVESKVTTKKDASLKNQATSPCSHQGMTGTLPIGKHLSHLSRNTRFPQPRTVPTATAHQVTTVPQEFQPDIRWLIDSGASHHMGHNIYDFQSLDLTLPIVRFGDGCVIQATRVGSVAFHTESGSILKLTDVLYIPTLTIAGSAGPVCSRNL